MMPPSTCGKSRAASAKFRGRVLIVDDEALVCWALAAGLRQAGFSADTASTAEEALRLARMRPQPDAIVMDARLPDCAPSILLRRLRAIAPECRFLMMTTEGHDVPHAPCDVLIVRKPFDLPDVIREVDAEVTRAGRH
jgi:DNA-binding response OmpR family regulator